MKNRPDSFLSADKISHESEAFDYINELHDYLWRFVRTCLPGANGHLEDYVDIAVELIEKGGKTNDNNQ